MSAAIISAVFGSLILAMLGWMLTLIQRLGDRIDHLAERVDDLAQRVARIEGRLDERAAKP